MSVKNVSLFATVLTLLGVGALHAQVPPPPLTSPYMPEGPPPQPGQVFAPQGPAPAHGLSSWILYNQPCCCGPLSDKQPWRYELYMRAGPSFPIEGEIYGRALETGWAIQGGMRILIFNQPQTKAWTVDLSLSNIHNNGRRPEVEVPIIRRDPNPDFIPQLPIGPDNQPFIRVDDPVKIRALNRTFVNLAGGCEWYLVGDGSGQGPAWRWGVDVGGSWGSAKGEFTLIRHRTDVVGRVFASLHSDLEIPYGCCTFMAGFRLEWDYSASSILQKQNDADMQEILLLGTLGFRF